MSFRYFFEIILFNITTLLFQFYIGYFNYDLHLAKEDLKHLHDEDENSEFTKNLKKHLLEELELGALELNEAMLVVSYNILFPLKIIAQIYFLYRTNRISYAAKFLT